MADQKDDSCVLRNFGTEWKGVTNLTTPFPDLKRYKLEFLSDGVKLR